MSSVSSEPIATISGLEGFRLQAKAEGFSDDSTELLSSKFRKGENKSYQYFWESLGSWKGY